MKKIYPLIRIFMFLSLMGISAISIIPLFITGEMVLAAPGVSYDFLSRLVVYLFLFIPVSLFLKSLFSLLGLRTTLSTFLPELLSPLMILISALIPMGYTITNQSILISYIFPLIPFCLGNLILFNRWLKSRTREVQAQ